MTQVEREIFLDWSLQVKPIAGLRTGMRHRIKIHRLSVWRVEPEGLVYGRKQILPLDMQLAMAAFVAAHKFAAKEADSFACCIGHASPEGSAQFNGPLSLARARIVYSILANDTDAWEQASKTLADDDLSNLLDYVAQQSGWSCARGDFAQLSDRVAAFQVEAARTHAPGLQADGIVGPHTRGALLAWIISQLEHELKQRGLPVDPLPFYHAEPAIGVAASIASTTTLGIDIGKVHGGRMVDLVFVRSGEIGSLAKFPVDPIYHARPVKRMILPLDAIPNAAQLPVHLRLVWLDPRGNARPFPKGFAMEIVYRQGASTQLVATGEDGELNWMADRRGGAFTLRYEGNAPAYFVSHQDGKEYLSTAQDLPNWLKMSARFWLVPASFSLHTCAVSVDASAAPTYANGLFDQLTGLTEIGQLAAPATVTIDPQWSFLRFSFCCRVTSKICYVQGLSLVGFREGSGPDGMSADTQSSWMVAANDCYALPWMVVAAQDGTPEPKPDAKSTIEFRTQPQTFVDTSATTHKLVTVGGSGQPGSDFTIIGGAPASFRPDQASGKRVAFYDLPAYWRTTDYFGRLSDGSGKRGFFADLVKTPTTATACWEFSLDDIVLMFAGRDGSLKPVDWQDDGKEENRVAIFAAKFGRCRDCNDYGLYRSDTANHRSYFSEASSQVNDRNYLVQYPNWTRLVVLRGNAFDVFSARTTLPEHGVIGARAAVMHWDTTKYPYFVMPIGVKLRTGLMRNRPDLLESTFFSIQSMFAQEQPDPWNPDESPSRVRKFRQMGRTDLVLLRCCGVEADGTTEQIRVITYHRLHFDHDPRRSLAKTDGALPSGRKGVDADKWNDLGISNLHRRWNGPDGSYNPAAPELRSVDPKAEFVGGVTLFAQVVPGELAHSNIGVFERAKLPNGRQGPWIRAFMVAATGRGVLEASNNHADITGRFTFAHEIGHSASLNDEYVDATSPINIVPFAEWLYGFDGNSPGDPYAIDDGAMMTSNKAVSARDYWPFSEWASQQLPGKPQLAVHHAGFKHLLPRHPMMPSRSYSSWPLSHAVNRELGEHGHFDVFVYALGEDRFSTATIPNLEKQVPVQTYDAIIVIVMKLRIDSHAEFVEKQSDTTHRFLNDFLDEARKLARFKYSVAGESQGYHFTKGIVDVSLRFWVRNPGKDYSRERPDKRRPHFKIDLHPNGDPAWRSESRLGILRGRHGLDFPHSRGGTAFADEYFPQMLGLAPGKPIDLQTISQLVRGVIAHAQVTQLRP